MNEVAKIAAETASKQAANPDYLPILLLFICIMALGWLFRWIVGELKGLFKEANEGRQKCAEAYATGTEVIRECKETICECRETMQECTAFFKRGSQ